MSGPQYLSRGGEQVFVPSYVAEGVQFFGFVVKADWPAAGSADTEIGCFRKPERAMQRRKFSREFKVEAVRLVRERGVSVAQASRDIAVHENILRKWVKELGADLKQAFPGNGQMKPEQLEIDRLRREVAKLKAERDILKKAAAYFAREST